MYIKLVPLLLTLMLAGCATHLTDAGRRIKVVRDAGAPDCARLGPVVGQAGSLLSGGEYGVIYATYDARNRAARIPGADTLVLTGNEERRFGGEVTGVAFDCTTRQAKAASKSAPLDAHRDQTGESAKKPVNLVPEVDIFTKAKICQGKGGVWINDRCVIPID